MRGRFEAGVALAALAAARHVHLLARRGEILQHKPAGDVEYHGAGRYANTQVVGCSPVPAGTLAMLAALGPPRLAVCQCTEAIDALFRNEDDTPAVAAVAAVGAAAWNVLLTAERDAPVATTAPFHFDFHLVDEHAAG